MFGKKQEDPEVRKQLLKAARRAYEDLNREAYRFHRGDIAQSVLERRRRAISIRYTKEAGKDGR
jgi:hypothetical protein